MADGRVDARAVLIDIDGVLTVSWEPLPGAVAALRALREAGLSFALVTNTTSRTRAHIAATLADAGFPVPRSDVLTRPPPRRRTCADTTPAPGAYRSTAATSPRTSTACTWSPSART